MSNTAIPERAEPGEREPGQKESREEYRQDSPLKTAKVALVGNPNVGKSAMFGNLTGRYAIVSNYPGTTVEITRGTATINGLRCEIVDTPGMYSLLPITEEERVARSILLMERPSVVVHTVDAKNLERMLPMTLQLLEAGLTAILDLNMMDEAEKLGLKFDLPLLQNELGIPAAATVSTTKRGLNDLKKLIVATARPSQTPPPPGRQASFGHPASPAGCPAAGERLVDYGPELERAIDAISIQLRGKYSISRRALALLLLQEDPEILGLVKQKEGLRAGRIEEILVQTRKRSPEPMNLQIAMRRQEEARRIAALAIRAGKAGRMTFGEWLSRIAMHPVSGVPIMLAVLYYGLYQFVGVFGAGTLVDYLEQRVFSGYLNPVFERVVAALLPWPVWRELFAGEYGILTLGVRYAIAIVFPIVGTFFLFFSVLEDSGYFPRLAMLVDRVFKKLGLNGRAAIPLVLGLGCGTMATLSTRILETRRERIIATFLLALSIPCSAQLGLIFAMLSGHPAGLLIWALVVGAVFIAAGQLSARLAPGPPPSFYMEVPPLRIPQPGNVLRKTYMRIEWYFMEIFPLFILASVFIWLGRISGVFQLVIQGLEPVVHLLGLPKETAVAILFGFFRRDYGAAGLYDLQASGQLAGIPLVVAAVTLTLFTPCIAQFSMMIKERGWRFALLAVLFIFPFAFFMGYVINQLLTSLGIQI
ncbi:MAG: ferrous iron transport protein B [Syntrophothermus sp.]